MNDMPLVHFYAPEKLFADSSHQKSSKSESKIDKKQKSEKSFETVIFAKSLNICQQNPISLLPVIQSVF